jgi:cell shape-determining protein MreC
VNHNIRTALLIIVFVVLISVGTLQPVEVKIRSLVSSIGNTFLPDNHVSKLVTESEIDQLAEQNQQLSNDLDLKRKRGDSLLAASIVARSSGLFNRAVVLNRGSDDGVKLNNAILAQGVIIGTVQSVNKNESTVLLIQDQDFRLDVAIDGGERGVLKGGINGPYVDRVLPGVKIVQGQLVSSGISNQSIPSGLPVGRTVGVLKDSDEVFQKVQIAVPILVNQVSSVQVVLR